MSEFKYEATKRIEKIQRAIVWHLPRWLIKWAVVRAVLHATNGKWGREVVPEVAGVEVLKRWGESNVGAYVGIHPNLVEAHNSIKWSRLLEAKQGYNRIIGWSRLPETIKVGKYTYKLKHHTVDDRYMLSYVDDKVPLNGKAVLMHYEESTLHACITKAWRRLAEDHIAIK